MTGQKHHVRSLLPYLQEDYAGSFKIYEMVDEYGSSVISNKSTSGLGYVAVDKRIRGSQGTYESGSGSYHSEEVIDFAQCLDKSQHRQCRPTDLGLARDQAWWD
jgi:hypothetical protein